MSAWLELADDMLGTCVDTFEHVVTILPLKSIGPGAPSYEARGIYRQQEVDVQTEDGAVMPSDIKTLDIRLSEFAVVPLRGDEVTFDGVTFLVDDSGDDGQGAGKLVLKEVRR